MPANGLVWTIAGKPGDNDLEMLLQAAASAWPANQPPIDTLKFEPGHLTLGATGWTPDQVAQFRGVLASAGWQVDFDSGRLSISKPATNSGAAARRST